MSETLEQEIGDSPFRTDERSPRIAYIRSYSFIFSQPNWFLTIVFASLCHMIPIVGQIVIVGYCYEIIERLHRQPRQVYPAFDFNRFTPYLTRGVWPWLIIFTFQMILQPLVMVVTYAAMIATIIALESDESVGSVVASIIIPVCILGLFALSIVMSLLFTPMLLRAGLAQEFSEGFKLNWVFDFIRRVWLELILATLFLLITMMVLCIAGMAFFCFGIVPAFMVVSLASAHLDFQLYQIYLHRGGKEIPLKPLTDA